MKGIVKIYNFSKWKGQTRSQKWARRKKLEIRCKQICSTIDFLAGLNILDKSTHDKLVEIWRVLRVECMKFEPHRKHRFYYNIRQDCNQQQFVKEVDNQIKRYETHFPNYQVAMKFGGVFTKRQLYQPN